jgi:hypothetical protein
LFREKTKILVEELRNKSWKPECVGIRIEINHESKNVFSVLTWIGGY